MLLISEKPPKNRSKAEIGNETATFGRSFDSFFQRRPENNHILPRAQLKHPNILTSLSISVDRGFM
jgi:hypothetical protein